MRAIKATVCILIAVALNDSSGDIIFDTYGNPEHTFDTTSGALVAWSYSPGFVTGAKDAVLFTAPSGTDWFLESVELPIKYADSLNLRFSIIQGSGNIPTGTTIWTTANPPGLYTGSDTFQHHVARHSDGFPMDNTENGQEEIGTNEEANPAFKLLACWGGRFVPEVCRSQLQ
jgi:hypothetical protein